MDMRTNKGFTVVLWLSIPPAILASLNLSMSFFYNEDFYQKANILLDLIIPTLTLIIFFMSILLSIRAKRWAVLVWLGFLVHFIDLSKYEVTYHLPGQIGSYFHILAYSTLLVILVLALQIVSADEDMLRYTRQTPVKTGGFLLIFTLILVLVPIEILNIYFIQGLYDEPNTKIYTSLLNLLVFVQSWGADKYFVSSGFIYPIFFKTYARIDLMVFAPLYAVTAYLLFRRKKWGYILGSILLIRNSIPLLFLASPPFAALFWAYLQDIGLAFQNFEMLSRADWIIFILESRVILFIILAAFSAVISVASFMRSKEILSVNISESKRNQVSV